MRRKQSHTTTFLYTVQRQQTCGLCLSHFLDSIGSGHRISGMALRVGSCGKIIGWKMISAAIFWSIWNEINRRCFDGISTTYRSLKSSCLMLLYSWVIYVANKFPCYLLEFYKLTSSQLDMQGR